jgi:hypothetical protein
MVYSKGEISEEQMPRLEVPETARASLNLRLFANRLANNVRVLGFVRAHNILLNEHPGQVEAIWDYAMREKWVYRAKDGRILYGNQ